MSAPTSSIYGPVHSWRVGQSLGVDLLYTVSRCSFRCVYCQLGKIEVPTLERGEFVSTAQVMADLEASDWKKADVVTFSGSGEPTLATNLGLVNAGIKYRTAKPTMLLTNSTLLHLPEVRKQTMGIDTVACKLDAADEAGLQAIDRPVEGVTLEKIVQGIEALVQEHPGKVAIQAMFMPNKLNELDAFAALLTRIQPHEVQLNTPKRPVPKGWFLDARGNYDLDTAPYPAVPLRYLGREDALALEEALRERTGLPIVSVYQPQEA